MSKPDAPARRVSPVLLAVAVAALALAPATPAAAHTRSLGRSVITIDDDGRGAELRLTLSLLDRDALYAAVGGPASLVTALTAGLTLTTTAGSCTASVPTELPAASGQVAYRWRVRCPAAPERLICDLLVDVVPGHVHLARVIDHRAGVDGGDRHDRVFAFGADQRTVVLARPTSVTGGVGFIRLGADHVTGGLDHLLFMLTLLLVAASLRELALAATGFTIGHSVALVLAVGAGTQPSAAGIEVLVAASIAVVAAEAAASRSGRHAAIVAIAVASVLLAVAAFASVSGGPTPIALVGLALLAGCYLAGVGRATRGHGARWRLLITTLFGLVHGFAFAGPLIDLDLGGRPLATALLAFNVGIELAQLLLLAIGWMMLSALRRRAPAAAALTVDVAAAVAMAPAMFWLITRSSP